MPPAIDTTEEIAAMLSLVLGVLAVVGVGIVGALAAVLAAWRAKIKPILTGTKSSADAAAHQLASEGSGSTRDAINRTEEMTGHLVDELEEMRREQREDRKEMRAEQRADRSAAHRTHSEIFRRIRELERPRGHPRPREDHEP